MDRIVSIAEDERTAKQCSGWWWNVKYCQDHQDARHLGMKWFGCCVVTLVTMRYQIEMEFIETKDTIRYNLFECNGKLMD